MEHEGSIGFVMRKMKKKILLIFKFQDFLMAKKNDLGDQKFPSVTHRCCCRCRRR
jgi:hypothetical protein